MKRRQFLDLGMIGAAGAATLYTTSALADRKKTHDQMKRVIPGDAGHRIRKSEYTGYHVISQPKDSHTVLLLEQMWLKVWERTNGWLNINVIPDSGNVPGADAENILNTVSGRFDVITIAGPAIDTLMPHVIPLQAMAYAYNNSNEARKIVNGRTYAECMDNAAREVGFKCLGGLLNAGMRQMTTISSRPLKTSKDFMGLVLRTPPSELYSIQYKALGIQSRQTAISEAFKEMKQGSVMGQENPVSYAVLLKFYEVCKFLNITNHMWSGFNTMINLEHWSSWPEPVQEAVNEEYRSIINRQWIETENINSRGVELLRSNGMVVMNTAIGHARKELYEIQRRIINSLDTRLKPIALDLIGR